jgi:hypothetical protein
MDNKRTAKRIPVEHPVALQIDDDTVQGTLKNLSTTGALFSFEGDARELVDSSVLGLDASFRIRPKGKPTRLYTGEMVRFYVREGKTYVALRFWSRYKELRTDQN